MADFLGNNPNHFDDVFAKFEEWEEILKSLDDFPVEEIDPPEPSP